MGFRGELNQRRGRDRGHKKPRSGRGNLDYVEWLCGVGPVVGVAEV